MKLTRVLALAMAAIGGVSQNAMAQRAEENAVRAADDAFGVQVGNDKIGLYGERDVRGFSPVNASNVRVEGLYFDMRGNIPSRLLSGTQIKVGITAQGYPFPAPTGIVDYQYRTIGDKPVFSALAQQGPNEGYSYEFDAYMPIDGKRFGISAGGVIRREEPLPGGSVQAYSFGTVARWKPTSNISTMAFYGHYDRYDGKTTPIVFTAGPFLPPKIKAQRFSQDWAQSDNAGDSYGSTTQIKLSSAWSLNAGIFRYFQTNSGNISETYLNTDANGLAASRRFSRDPENKSDSYSGEARLTGVFTRDGLRHTVHFTYKAREAMRTFGGSGQVVTGPTQIGGAPTIPEPVFTLHPTTRDEISQSALGFSYSMAIRGFGEFTASAQKADYRKLTTPPVLAQTETLDAPLLHNFALALTPLDKVVVYASFARGLEDANNAPDIAVNAAEAPPAIRTRQFDGGVRYTLTPRMKLIAGFFNIEKPYFNLDPGNVYRQLGIETHAGYEISLAGAVNDDLNIVAGAVLMKPKVTGEAVTSGQIGPKPVGQARTIVKLNADYRIQKVKGLSIDAAINYSGPRAASSRTFAALGDTQLMTEGVTTLDLGTRYRFKAYNHPVTARAQVLNATDAFAWQVGGSGAFNVSNPRAFQATLTVDF